ncbi:11687_t:CDS:2 [Gigaspora margarita]|uniref:11687_t:CDS:1 n=1 Tax=Gigaspora margarita TaxID=4874 RepID=A0ABN7VBS3_GIGMA|nr:11687_t:CDS:2 [Gigaspora margarita]
MKYNGLKYFNTKLIGAYSSIRVLPNYSLVNISREEHSDILIKIEVDSNELLGQAVDTKDQEDDDNEYEELEETNIESQEL